MSVTVSILTLTFISIDRWYAICFPLRYKPQTSRAVIWIAIIWLIALLFDLPEFLALHTYTKRLRFDIQLFTQCMTLWTPEEEKTFCIIRAVFLYTWVFSWKCFYRSKNIFLNFRSDFSFQTASDINVDRIHSNCKGSLALRHHSRSCEEKGLLHEK